MKEKFSKIARVIDMQKEYPGNMETFRYLIFTDLTKWELLSLYPEEMRSLRPFEIASVELWAPIVEYNNCERRAKVHSGIPLEDGLEEILTDENIITDPLELLESKMEYEEKQKRVNSFLKTRKEKERRIYQAYFRDEMTLHEIAEMEGNSYEMIRRTVKRLESDLKKWFETER